MSLRDGRRGDGLDEHDPAEIWGRRIGRGLGFAAVLVMAWWLGQQLRLW